MRNGLLIGLTFLGLPLAGCDRDQTSSTPAAPASVPANTAPAPATQPAAAAPADGAPQRAAAESTARGAVDGAVAGTQAATTRAQTQAAATAATAQMTADEAKGMLNEAMNYIRENKYDLAEKALNQVEASKDKLPKGQE